MLTFGATAACCRCHNDMQAKSLLTNISLESDVVAFEVLMT